LSCWAIRFVNDTGVNRNNSQFSEPHKSVKKALVLYVPLTVIYYDKIKEFEYLKISENFVTQVRNLHYIFICVFCNDLYFIIAVCVLKLAIVI
jgi:hypothetical protein